MMLHDDMVIVVHGAEGERQDRAIIIRGCECRLSSGGRQYAYDYHSSDDDSREIQRELEVPFLMYCVGVWTI